MMISDTVVPLLTFVLNTESGTAGKKGDLVFVYMADDSSDYCGVKYEVLTGDDAGQIGFTYYSGDELYYYDKESEPE
jgi:hypothetical protein